MTSLLEMAQADNAAVAAAGTADPGVASTDTEVSAVAAVAAPETPPPGEAVETPPEAGTDVVETAEAYPLLLEHAAELFDGKVPDSLAKYKNIDEMLKAHQELNSLVGRQAHDVALARYLQENGLSQQNLPELVAYLQAKASGANGNGQPAPAQQENWREWVDFDNEGKPAIRTGAPPDAIAGYNQHVRRMQDAFRDPAKLAELVKPYLRQDVEQTVQKTRAELAQETYQREALQAWKSWEQQHAKEVFVGGDVSKGLTPLALKANELIDSGRYAKTLTPTQILDAALEDASLRLQPRAAVTAKVTPAARRQAAVASATPSKMTWQEIKAKLPPGRNITLAEHQELAANKIPESLQRDMKK